MQQIYNPYSQYVKQNQSEIEHANPIQLVSLLLEGTTRFIKRALIAVDNKNNKEVLESIDSASKIIIHLYNCLDFEKGGDVAERLSTLYSYIIEQITHVTKHPDDKGSLNSINEVLNIILDGWKQVERKVKSV